MGNVKKVFKTFIPYIVIIAAIVTLAVVSQIWVEVKEDPTEIQFVSSVK
jgi:hypothetical protein